jgi:hypothetical protein
VPTPQSFDREVSFSIPHRRNYEHSPRTLTLPRPSKNNPNCTGKPLISARFAPKTTPLFPPRKPAPYGLVSLSSRAIRVLFLIVLDSSVPAEGPRRGRGILAGLVSS